MPVIKSWAKWSGFHSARISYGSNFRAIPEVTPPPVVMEVCDIVPAFEATAATGFCMIVPRTRLVYRTVIC